MSTSASNTPARIACPACGGRVKIPAGMAGERFRCPRCDAEINASGGLETAVSGSPPTAPTDDDGLFDPLPATGVAPLVEQPPAVQPSPDSLSRAPSSESAESDEFAVHCPLCGTLQYAKLSQIGSTVRCADCHTPVVVRAPQPRRKPAVSAASKPDDDDEYRLSDVVERPPLADVHERLLVAAERELETERKTPVSKRPTQPTGPTQPPQPTKPAVGDVFAASARDLMGKAEAEAKEIEREAARYVVRPLFTGLFSFLFDVQAIARLIALTFLSLGCVVFLHLFISLKDGGAVQQFGAVFVGMLLAPLSLIYISLTSVCWLVIVQDTANGLDKVEQWPGLNFLDWMFDAFYVLNSLFLSALPGILFGQLAVLSGLGGQWVALLLGAMTAVPLFPVILLSTLDAGSPLGLWSNALARNMIRHWATTKQFFLGSAVLAVAAIVFLVVMAQQMFLVSLVGAAGFNAATMIYFRLLGRLAGLVVPEHDAGDAKQD